MPHLARRTIRALPRPTHRTVSYHLLREWLTRVSHLLPSRQASVCCNALSFNRSMRARFMPSTCFALFVWVKTSNVIRNPSCRFPTRPTRATEMRKTSSAFALSIRSRISYSSLSSLSPDLSACTNRAAVLFSRSIVSLSKNTFISSATPVYGPDLLHNISSL